MNLIDLISLVVFSFGCLCFAALAFLWYQEQRRSDCLKNTVYGVMAVYATVWFAVSSVEILLSAYRQDWGNTLQIWIWVMAFVWPPLIIHLHYSEASSELGRGWFWRSWVAIAYVLAALLGSMPALYLAGLISGRRLIWPSFGLPFLFGIVAVFAILVSTRTRQKGESLAERQSRRWHFLLWALVVLVMMSFMLEWAGPAEGVLDLVARSFPLLFVFVNVYYLERFVFLDVFVKRGIFFLLTLMVLVVYFRLLAGLPAQLGEQTGQPWFYAITLLPIALSLPWLYRRLERWIDRVFLGRQFTPHEAVKYFLSGVQNLTSEQELVEDAQQRLSAILQTETRIQLHSGSSAGPRFESSLEVPVRLAGNAVGTVRVARRPNGMPFFRNDIALLTSLADVLSYLLENFRLQERKQEQEKQAKELMIHASRSELKALRAQINPHFLFNALNAIAGLIYGEPERAEQTVERLAEVFRYTLKGSEKEWTSLAEEMDFVRAYLDVEKARFGERLTTAIEMDPGLREHPIPTMLIQTLVENAIKHGVARIRSVGRVSVKARKSGSRVRIEVRDNGPGFEREDDELTRGTGFGLRNIKERLVGYFEDDSLFEQRRDESAGETLVAIEIPYRSEERIDRRATS